MKNNRSSCFWLFALLMLMSGGCSKKLENPEIRKVNFQAADHGKMIPELSDLIRARLKGIRMKGLLIYNNSDDKDGTGIEKSIGETETNIYNDIMNQYIDAVDKEFPPQERMNYKREERWSLLGDEVNMYLIINAHAFESYKVYYALYDVDGNGTPELFIGGPWGRNTPPVIYDIFTFDNVQAINPFTELYDGFGHRTNLYFYTNGIFEVHWSNGGYDNGEDFYRLSENGYSVEFIETVSRFYGGYEENRLRYYHDAERKKEISQKEADAILQKYMAVGEADLKWSEIVKE